MKIVKKKSFSGMMDEDGEIPSRNYLKNQALTIVEVKSKRKNYRSVSKRK